MCVFLLVVGLISYLCTLLVLDNFWIKLFCDLCPNLIMLFNMQHLVPSSSLQATGAMLSICSPISNWYLSWIFISTETTKQPTILLHKVLNWFNFSLVTVFYLFWFKRSTNPHPTLGAHQAKSLENLQKHSESKQPNINCW